jgi:hypothetical protein
MSGAGLASPFKQKRSLMLVGLIVLILILVGGYVFAFYLPNTPDNIYKTSLGRTATGYDKLVDYLSTQENQHYKGSTTTGDFKFTSSEISGDGSLSAQTDGHNTTGKLNMDIAGQKLGLDFRGIQPSGQTTPDVYLRLNGIKSLLDTYGLEAFDSTDGQWVVVDHTLIESALQSAGQSSGTKVASPKFSQVQDALDKVGQVNRKYLFTTDTSTAVLVKKKNLGESKRDGREVQGYLLGYSKTNLKAYVRALGTALDQSSLNDWYKQTSDGKSISSQMAIDDMVKSIDRADGNYTFTMYVDTGTKLIETVHFPDSSSGTPASYLELGLHYTGGSSYPFVLKLSGDEGDSSFTGTLTMTLNTDTKVVAFKVNLTFGDHADSGVFTANLTFRPSNQQLHLTTPAGAQSITDLVQSLGLGDLFSNPGASSSGDSLNDPLGTKGIMTLTQ